MTSATFDAKRINETESEDHKNEQHQTHIDSLDWTLKGGDNFDVVDQSEALDGLFLESSDDLESDTVSDDEIESIENDICDDIRQACCDQDNTLENYGS